MNDFWQVHVKTKIWPRQKLGLPEDWATWIGIPVKIGKCQRLLIANLQECQFWEEFWLFKNLPKPKHRHFDIKCYCFAYALRNLPHDISQDLDSYIFRSMIEKIKSRFFFGLNYFSIFGVLTFIEYLQQDLGTHLTEWNSLEVLHSASSAKPTRDQLRKRLTISCAPSVYYRAIMSPSRRHLEVYQFRGFAI